MSRRLVILILACFAALATSGCDQILVNEPSPMVVEGAYDTETRYDMETLSGALTGSVQSWESPEQAIRAQILKRFEDKYGQRIAGLIRTSYGQRIADDIISYLTELAPDWLLALPGKLSIVDAQMRMVDVQTSFLLAEQADGTIKATQIWNGISVFRDPDCRKAGNLSCDQINISIQELLDAEYPIELASSTFTGTYTGQNLNMTGHEVRFNYGRLALYLMTNLALPDEPGAGLQLRDVVLAAINCRGLAGRLTGDKGVLGWEIAGVQVGLSVNDIIGSCEDGVFSMINGFIDQFNVPMAMNLSGAIQLIDSNGDRLIDQLATRDISGELGATLLSGQVKEGPVSGQLTGWRVGELPEEIPEAGETTDIDDGVPIWESGDGAE